MVLQEMSVFTLKELLEVVHEKLPERRALGPLQSVDQLLDFG